jgi:hypothetical protein
VRKEQAAELERTHAVVQKLGELFGGEFVKYLERQVAAAQPSGEGEGR